MKTNLKAAAARPALAPPPPPGRARERWLQHAAGRLLFADVRGYALGKLGKGLDAKTRAVAERAIDDTLYGLMMVAEGVSGRLTNGKDQVVLSLAVRLEENGNVVDRLDLADGDGACMGFHGWLEGDFGAVPVVAVPGSATGKR